jgi:hypothetical protein
MQFENFDNKIRQAADQHHPDYDEKAWAKMEKLLDRELPQDKDRRRIIFLLFFFLLLGGGAWLVINRPWKQTSITSGDKNLQSLPVVDSGKETVKARTGNIPLDKKQKEEPVSAPDNKSTTIPANTGNDIVVKGVTDDQSNHPVTLVGRKTKTTADKKIKASKTNFDKQDQLDILSVNPGKIAGVDKPAGNIASVSPDKRDDLQVKKNISKNDLPADDKTTTVALQNKDNDTKKNKLAEEPKKADEKSTTGANRSKKRNSFFFSFSAGPDVSYVGLDNPGKIKLLGGAGIGYTIKDRVTIRTGFYTTHKVYTASKYDYKPSVPVMGYNYLDKIDANCNVYEIPLSLAYSFGKSEKENMFVSAGLSSFIMKKETYDYLFKYPGNPTLYTYTKTINNENKHYFSVLALSGGYQRRINKILSLSAEPYIKLPLGGVGYGKVKLNSAGILFSANIKPFN